MHDPHPRVVQRDPPVDLHQRPLDELFVSGNEVRCARRRVSPRQADVIDALHHDHVSDAGLHQDILVEPCQRADTGAIPEHAVAADAGVEHAEPALAGVQPVRETDADLVVAGAYSASGLKKLFFGSTAKGLLEDSPIPLFLYH